MALNVNSINSLSEIQGIPILFEFTPQNNFTVNMNLTAKIIRPKWLKAVGSIQVRLNYSGFSLVNYALNINQIVPSSTLLATTQDHVLYLFRESSEISNITLTANQNDITGNSPFQVTLLFISDDPTIITT